MQYEQLCKRTNDPKLKFIEAVIVCKGDAWTPARFWNYKRIQKKDLKKYQEHGWVLVTWDVQLKEK